MATRIYLPSSGSAAVTPSSWVFTANTPTTYTYKGVLTKGTTSLTTLTEATGTTSPTHRGMVRYVLGPLAGQTISGSLTGQIRCSESNAGANATIAVAVKIIQPNGSDRATLLSQAASDATTTPPEMSTSLYTRALQDSSENTSISLTSQAATAGDYLVIELGFRSATSTTRNISLRVGDNSSSDLSSGSTTTDTNDYAPWVEFSGNLTWQRTGSLAATESGSDSFSATGDVIVQGGFAATESGADTFSSTGDVIVQGGLSAAENGADTFSASGTVAAAGASGSLAVTEAGTDTLYAFFTDGVLRDDQREPITDGDGNILHDGWVPNIGPFSATETGADTFAASGTVADPSVTGTFAATETGSDAFASSGKVIVSGALAVTETGNDTFASSGKVVVSGTLAAPEAGDDTFAASGDVIVTGTLAVTESGSDTFASSGAVLVEGDLAAQETGADTFFASGAAISTGTLTATESGSDVFASSGAVIVDGTLEATESGSDTFSASGDVYVSGSLAATESGNDTFYAAGAGVNVAQGSLAATETGADRMDAFFTDGIVRDSDGEPVLDSGGNFVYDGYVTAIGPVAAVESGADAFAASGSVSAVVASGSMAATESGSDSCAIPGKILVSGAGTIIESGSDVVAISGTTGHFGALAATESSSDAINSSGYVLVRGSLYAFEQGDSASIGGKVYISGAMGATESGADSFETTRVSRFINSLHIDALTGTIDIAAESGRLSLSARSGTIF